MERIKKFKISFALLLICGLFLIAVFIPWYGNEYNDCYNQYLKHSDEYYKLRAAAIEYEDQYDEMYSSHATKKLAWSKSEYSKYEAEMLRLKRISELYEQQARSYQSVYVTPYYQRYMEVSEKRTTLQTVLGVISGLLFVGTIATAIIVTKKEKPLNNKEIHIEEK